MSTIVNSWNEWDPLKHVIVGRADDCHIPPEEPALDAKVPEDSDMRGQWGRRPQDSIDRANELLDNFATMLASRGIKVDRPTPIDFSLPAITPDFQTESQFGCMPPRDVLYARIDARFDVMLEQGAMDEVRQLMSRQLDPSLPLMKALGVTALKAVLEQEMTVDEAAYIAKRDSRHYAKRQMTWLRNNYNAQITLNTKLSESFMESIFSLIR